MKNQQGALKTEYIVLGAILAINILLKWRYFTGLVEADDFSYGVYAFSFFRIPLTWDMIVDFRVFRLAMILPVSLIFNIFGPSEFTAVLYTIILTLLNIVLVYLIGRRLWSAASGLFAAFIIATFPADIMYSTMLLPDGIVPVFITLAVWAFIEAEHAEPVKARLFYLLVGFSTFLAFNVRENSYYFILFFVPFIFNRARWEKGLWASIAGFAIPVIILYSIYYLKSGDFLYNLHLAQHHREPLIESGYIPRNSDNWFGNIFYMFPGFFKSFDGNRYFASSIFGMTFYAGFPIVLYSAFKAIRKRNLLLLIPFLWFMVVYLYLEFGSISFTQYQTMRKLNRFLLTLTPAMALAWGVWLSDAFGWTNGKKIRLENIKWITAVPAVLLTLFMLFTSVAVLETMKMSRQRNMAPYRWGYSLLKDREHSVVYETGGWWINKLSFYMLPDIRYAYMPWRRSTYFRSLQDVEDPYELAGTYVIVDRTNFNGNNDLRIHHSYEDFGDWVKSPPGEWILLGANYGTEIYQVPENWVYTPLSEEELVTNALLHSVNMQDNALFFYSVHPEFVSELDFQNLRMLVTILAEEENPGRKELLENRLDYREYQGKKKVWFNLD